MPSLVDVVVSMVSLLLSSSKVSEAGADDELSHITREKWYILKVKFWEEDSSVVIACGCDSVVAVWFIAGLAYAKSLVRISPAVSTKKTFGHSRPENIRRYMWYSFCRVSSCIYIRS